jgi:hypothetical protein
MGYPFSSLLLALPLVISISGYGLRHIGLAL